MEGRGLQQQLIFRLQTSRVTAGGVPPPSPPPPQSLPVGFSSAERTEQREEFNQRGKIVPPDMNQV